MMNEDLLKELACPECPDRPPVTYTENKLQLKCSKCGSKFQISDVGIPILIKESLQTDDKD